MDHNEELMEFVRDTFKDGHTLLRINQKAGEEKVTLTLEKELLPFTYKTVHLLSPYPYHERSLLGMYVEELISILPVIQEEEIIHPSLLSVVETLLRALDYLTHERFIRTGFEGRHREHLYKILRECFESEKNEPFSTFANRPQVCKSEWMEKDGELFCLDPRQEKTRIYLAVFYKKPQTMMEHFKDVGHWLSQISLKPNTSKVEYEEAMKGKTDHELHVDTLYYLGMVQRTFSWLLNCSSWRSNELFHYDKIELRCKLGIRE